jgi:P27 family predicted phage terminase small subunit
LEVQLNTKSPEHLSKDGQTFFSQVIAEFEIADAAGLALLLTACEARDRAVAARRVIQAEGEVITDRYGQSKVHPACALEKDSRNGFLAALRALSLDISPALPVGRPTTPLGWTGEK